MKAISLWQPWASAIVLGMKRIETRHWLTRYRGPIAIHAAKRWTSDERELHALEVAAGTMPATLPLGAIVATARLAAIFSAVGQASQISPEELRWGNYAGGRFAWMFEDITPLAEPVPFRGLQGLFDVPDELLSVTASAAPQGQLL